MTSFSFLRHLASLVLATCFATYAWHSMQKYRLGQVSVAEATRRQDYFSPPAVTACGSVTRLDSHGTTDPPIVKKVALMGRVSTDGGLTDKQIFAMFPFGQPPTQPDPFELGDGGFDFWHSFVIGSGASGFQSRLLLCNTFRLPKEVQIKGEMTNQLFFVLDSSRLPPSGNYFFVGFDDPDILSPYVTLLRAILLPPQTSQDPSVTKFVPVAISHGEQVTLKSSSLPEWPCLEDAEIPGGGPASIMKCFTDAVSARAPCYGMGEPLGMNCSGEAESDEVETAHWEMFDGSEDQFLLRVGCRLPCRRRTFGVRLGPAIDGNMVLEHTSNTTTIMGVYSEGAGGVTVSTEFLVYDAGSLAGDVGGMLGMLLGASAMGTFDAAAGAVRSLLTSKLLMRRN